MVPNSLVVLYDTRCDSSGIFYYPIPVGGRRTRTMYKKNKNKHITAEAAAKSGGGGGGGGSQKSKQNQINKHPNKATFLTQKEKQN